MTNIFFQFDSLPESKLGLGWGGALERLKSSEAARHDCPLVNSYGSADESRALSEVDEFMEEAPECLETLCEADDCVEAGKLPKAFDELRKAMVGIGRVFGPGHFMLPVLEYDRARIMCRLGFIDQAGKLAENASRLARPLTGKYPCLQYIICRGPVLRTDEEFSDEDICQPLFPFDAGSEHQLSLGFESALQSVATREERELEVKAPNALAWLLSAERMVGDPNELEDALTMLRGAARAIERAYPEDTHFLLPVIIYDMARIRSRQGKFEEAGALADQATDAAAPLLARYSWLAYVVAHSRPPIRNEEYSDEEILNSDGVRYYGRRFF